MWVLFLPACMALDLGPRSLLKVTQFTDLHFGESAASDGLASSLQEALLEAEQPDVAVLTGDMVSGYAWDGSTNWYAQQYQKFTAPMRAKSVHWALTLGNHDTEADLTGEEIMRLDASQELSLARDVPTFLNHSSNYFVPITRQGELVFVLWLLDSGNRHHCLDRHGYDCVHEDQLQWLQLTQAALFTARRPVPGLVFMHIPPPEFMLLWEEGEPLGNKYEDVSCWAANSGFLSRLQHILGLVVGHDHFNDYSGLWDGIQLYYGRKTGHAGSGPHPHFLRGARTFLVDVESGSVTSYIRDEAGSLIVHNASEGLTHMQTLCAESSGWSLTAHKTLDALALLLGAGVCGAVLYLACAQREKRKASRFLA